MEAALKNILTEIYEIDVKINYILTFQTLQYAKRNSIFMTRLVIIIYYNFSHLVSQPQL